MTTADRQRKSSPSGCLSLLLAMACAIYGIWNLAAGDPGAGTWALVTAWLAGVLSARTQELRETRSELERLRRIGGL